MPPNFSVRLLPTFPDFRQFRWGQFYSNQVYFLRCPVFPQKSCVPFDPALHVA